MQEFGIEKYGYEFHQLIGTGAFSKVYKGSFTDKSGERFDNCAIKVVDLYEAKESYREKFLPREIEIMRILRSKPHLNIIDIHVSWELIFLVILTEWFTQQLFEIFQDVIERHDKVFMIMRIAERGTLRYFVEDRIFLKEKLMKSWFRQIVNGVDHLHTELNIAHRDLKMDNILISANLNIKIVDFGMSKQANYDDMSSSFCGSQAYLAPEKAALNVHNIFKADIFSLGVILFCCLNGQLPYDVRKTKDTKLSQSLQLFDFREGIVLSQDCLDVIYECMKVNANHRPTTSELLKMEWMLKKV